MLIKTLVKNQLNRTPIPSVLMNKLHAVTLVLGSQERVHIYFPDKEEKPHFFFCQSLSNVHVRL